MIQLHPQLSCRASDFTQPYGAILAKSSAKNPHLVALKLPLAWCSHILHLVAPPWGRIWLILSTFSSLKLSYLLMQNDIPQNLLKMQNHSSERVFRTLITLEINYLGFRMHIDRFGTLFEIRDIGSKNCLCAQTEP